MRGATSRAPTAMEDGMGGRLCDFILIHIDIHLLVISY